MVRAVAILVLLVGCDQVWQLDRNDKPPVCGPFGEPTLVPFHPELIDPYDFSVDSSGTRGMAYGMFMRAARPTGVHLLKLENDVWRVDAARDNGAITSLDGGHIAENNSAVGWLVEEGLDLPEVREYSLSTVNNMWAQSTTGIVDAQQGQTSTAGNVIVLPFGGVATVRFIVTVLVADRATERNTMRIFQNYSTTPTRWELTPQADLLTTSAMKINPSAGVMTADHEKLVYAAKVGKSTVSRFYASPRIEDRFEPSDPVSIEGVDSDVDLTEPWINADCSALYFRRDNQSWMASVVDASGTPP